MPVSVASISAAGFPLLPRAGGHVFTIWRSRIACSLICAFALALLSPPSHAAGFRCDQSVVSKGFTFYEVAERCGEPAFEFSRVDYRYPGYTVQIDEWTYDMGRNKFRRLLRFENGRLVDIQTRRKPRGSYLTRY